MNFLSFVACRAQGSDPNDHSRLFLFTIAIVRRRSREQSKICPELKWGAGFRSRSGLLWTRTPRAIGAQDVVDPRAAPARMFFLRESAKGSRPGSATNLEAEFQQPLRYSAATGGNRLGEFTLGERSAEWDAKLAEPFVLGAFISAIGLSERRDFPSK
jgi:hypothetical protein